MAEQKTYLKCSAKAKSFEWGTKLLIGVKVDDLIRFANEHQNERGYLNLTVTERKEPSKYGDTHSVALDTYQPKAKASGDDDPIPF